MKKTSVRAVAFVAALVSSSLAEAIDFTPYSDLAFAEKYAFSTNRPALIATLKKNTGPWYFYSLLNLQTEGRYAEAKKFVKTASRGERDAQAAWEALALREMFLEWEDSRGKPRPDGRTPDEFLAWELESQCRIKGAEYVREVPVKPNTYPSTLDNAKLSFESICGEQLHASSGGCFEDRFRFLAYSDVLGRSHNFDRSLACTPETPGFYEAVLTWVTEAEKARFTDAAAFKCLTLRQLEALQHEVCEVRGKKELAENEQFIALVRSKLAASTEEDVENDPDARRAVLDRELKFFRTLPASKRKYAVDGIGKILELERQRGNFAEKALFREYVEATITDEDAKKRLSVGELEKAYLAAYRRAGSDLAEFAPWFSAQVLAKIRVESDLTAGVDPAKTEVEALSESEYREIVDRVELKWSATNPGRFRATDEVVLAIDVKNVPKMRLAIYELDAFAATVKLGAEVKSDIDLDGCVPSVDRTIDYSAIPSVVRHRETLKLPELAKSGLYVVECSGAGFSSRALVRKGTLRIGERLGAGGLVFTALDEDGNLVKPASLRLGSTTFTSDERGEIAVPFAVPKESGDKTAVIGAGSCAVLHRFAHPSENYQLELSGVLPAEGVVAGRLAKAVLHPTLQVAGTPISLGFLEKPVLKIKFTDLDGIETMRVVDDVKLSDDAELEVPFTAPASLWAVGFELSGTVRNVSEQKDVTVAATESFAFNGLCRSERIEQAFLRRGADGYTLELRGRNGEALAAREVRLDFKHLVFSSPHSETLQTDAEGLIHLGKLADITFVSLTAPFEQSWYLEDETTRAIPSSLTAVEGEKIEFAVRGLADGAWPKADELNARVSLVAKNRAGAITADCLEAVSYTNGVLSIDRLLAGDYTLTLRAEQKTIDIKVTHTTAKEIAGGLIVGRNRALADTGAPGRMRIADAAIGADGTLKVKLVNAGEGARVHLAACRFVPDMDGGYDLFSLLAEKTRPTAMVFAWSVPRTDYVSGRDLGDKLRYILDRRNLLHRPGNMLDRPSLLLNPWSPNETRTKEETLRAGNAWAAAESAAAGRLNEPAGQYNGSQSAYNWLDTTAPSVDFLADAAKVWVNLRPDQDGVVTFKVPVGAEFQDFDVVAVDAEGADRVRLFGATKPLVRRDRRYFAAKPGEFSAPRTKSYGTVGELYRMLAEDDPKLNEFGFIAEWGSLDDAARRELYGKYASHELDLFLYFKDRRFFDAVVAPNLRNKRFKRFTDKWLLGEDLSEFTRPGVMQDLNALERCLLAKRVPAVAKAVADALSSDCAAHPVDPQSADLLLAKALGTACDSELKTADGDVDAEACEEPPGVMLMRSPVKMKSLGGSRSPDWEDTGWSNQAVTLSADRAAELKSRNLMTRKSMRVSRTGMIDSQAVADRARRESRQLYRPPERTREWVETHHYQLRQGCDTTGLVANNPFWAAYARAIVDGSDESFRTTEVMFAGGTLTQVLGALAVIDLPLVKDDAAKTVVFTERRIDMNAPGERDLGVVQRFFDPLNPVEDDEHGGLLYNYAIDEFVAGRMYALSTVLSNPTDRRVPTYLRVQIPDGAIALGSVPADRTFSFDVSGRSMVLTVTKFYFPAAEDAVGALAPAVASVDGRVRGVGEAKRCMVVAKATKEDRTSWRWISQNGTDDAVIAFLETANLASSSVDLALMGWRMKDAAFAKRAFATLAARGVYHAGLWSTALAGRSGITDNEARVRELLMTSENRHRLAAKLGPSFHCSIIDIDPEETDLYEHREYWPLINARVHALGGKATIPNESLKRQYRAFLDVLATHRELTAKDRLDAAVYLIAQDRVDEAERMVAAVKDGDVDTKMQLDYLKAYLAFSRLDPEAGRKLAEPYADYPVARWRDRFRKVIAQADEIAGRGRKDEASKADDIASAPSLELVESGSGKLTVKSRNVKRIVVKAFPTDVEVTFSKDPFGGDGVKSASSFLKPAWTASVVPDTAGEAAVELPAGLRSANLIVEVTDGDERVSASKTVLSGALDVQVVAEYGELRVRGASGRPLAAAYVKVYARDESARQIRFWKDGYTDLRGAFDYAGVSTDSEFRPAEFAVLVLHDTEGVKTVRAPRP